MCAWNYCTYDAVGLATFAFNLYDREGRGIISNAAMYELIEESYDIRNTTKQGDWGADIVKNTPEYNMKLTKLKIAKAAGHDEQMDLKEWIRYTRTAPNLLKKAYVMQSRLQQDICGEKFWETMTRKRRRKTKYNKEIIDWASIDEILHTMKRDPVLAKILKLESNNKRDGKTAVTKEHSMTSSSSGGSSGGGGGRKKKSKKNKSKYSTSDPRKEEATGKSLKRVRSLEEDEFTRTLPSLRNTGKTLKRKKSAENIQKMMRMKLAQKKTQRMRRAKQKLRAVGKLSSRSVR